MTWSAAPPGARRLLGPRPVTGIEWGLERIRRVLDGLGRPEEAFVSLHVGGTNGKGSVAAMAESVLRSGGTRTGLYTSPELLDFSDRIVIDGAPAPADLLEECAARVRPLADETSASFFEAATALAFEAFREAGVETAAVEVGLGGRLDATNVLRPAVTAITTVARDHTAHLGETIAEIAAEKAGILKPGVPAVVGPLRGEAIAVVGRRAEEVGAPIARLGTDARVESVEVTGAGTSFRYVSPRCPGGLALRLPLPGRHQAANAGVALMALERLPAPPDPAAIRRGLSGLRWPGRFQQLRRGDGLWILDAAHNGEAFRALHRTLRDVDPPDPIVFLLAILEDKEWDGLLDPLLADADAVVVSVPPSAPPERAWRLPEARTRLAADRAGSRIEAAEDFHAALARARELAGAGTVVVTGSCYAVGDALRGLRQ